MPNLSRRQLLAGGVGAATSLVSGGVLAQSWSLLAREDLIPGRAPVVDLQPDRWRTTDDEVVFAALGDNGSGGRQAMAVAEQLALTYQHQPFGHVSLLGDICYYGPIRRRFDEVFLKPMGPLIDAGVEFELAVGNHDGGLYYDDETLQDIEDRLVLLGTPARFYASTRGPVDFFYLDSSAPGLVGPEGSAQLEWLDDALSSATSRWRIVALHHPIYSSGRHGPTPRLDLLLEPMLVRHRVDLVLSGHDHHYERTVPIDGVTHVVSGGGCKLTPVHPSPYTAFAVSALQFTLFHVRGDRLTGRAISPGGLILDEFELEARR